MVGLYQLLFLKLLYLSDYHSQLRYHILLYRENGSQTYCIYGHRAHLSSCVQWRKMLSLFSRSAFHSCPDSGPFHLLRTWSLGFSSLSSESSASPSLLDYCHPSRQTYAYKQKVTSSTPKFLLLLSHFSILTPAPG